MSTSCVLVACLSDLKISGVLFSIILIRVPVVFRIVWAFVKHFIDQHVASKMEICGKNHREVLSRYVDLEILPSVIAEEGQGRVVDGLPPNLKGGPLVVPSE